MRLLAFLLLAALPLQAQVFGAVTGHVLCADTNAPARLADVTLMPIPEKIAPGDKPRPAPAMTINKTGLDGSFTIPRVPAGRYYVVVHKFGYLAPDVEFSKAEIENPDEATQAEIARLVPIVAVAAGQSSSVDLRLLRGASISGTVRFDDGTLFDGKQIALERRLRTGKWEYMGRADNTGFQTADYSFLGLPAGDYRLRASLTLSDRVTDNLFGSSGTTYFTGGYILALYLGDTFRIHDAVIVKLHEGEASTGRDFTVPLAKLHSLSGAVVEERTGKAINVGQVTLVDEDGTAVAGIDIGTEDATFRFPFVPEGTYRIKVSGAREVARELLPESQSTRPSIVPHYKETTLRSFAQTEKPVIIQTDMTGVLIPATPLEAKPAK